MTTPASVGSIVLIVPGSTQRRGGYAARPAIVTAITGTAAAPTLSATVFQEDGAENALHGVPHQAVWTAAGSSDAAAYWQWPAAIANSGTN